MTLSLTEQDLNVDQVKKVEEQIQISYKTLEEGILLELDRTINRILEPICADMLDASDDVHRSIVSAKNELLQNIFFF